MKSIRRIPKLFLNGKINPNLALWKYESYWLIWARKTKEINTYDIRNGNGDRTTKETESNYKKIFLSCLWI